MKLFYYNGTSSSLKVGNFGDDLNPWLWQRLIPDILSMDSQTVFVGIGTLLNEHLPEIAQKIIFGSGVGYGKVPIVDYTWKVYFVRGQLSAKALGLKPELGITDPAILIRRFFIPSGKKNYKYSFMPHFSEEIHNGAGWREICLNLDFHYIDPTAPVEQILAEISESEVLLAEAMHGAIVADALRTPWVAVKTKKGILDFKWNDWLSSINLPYEPYSVRRMASIIGRKGFLRTCDYQAIILQMYYIARTARPSLSSQLRCDELEEKVIEKLEILRTDVKEGLY